jgi:hypothetical protein
MSFSVLSFFSFEALAEIFTLANSNKILNPIFHHSTNL